MAIKQRVYHLEKMITPNTEEPFVMYLRDETHTPEEIEAARKQATEEGGQIVFIGKLAEWSK